MFILPSVYVFHGLFFFLNWQGVHSELCTFPYRETTFIICFIRTNRQYFQCCDTFLPSYSCSTVAFSFSTNSFAFSLITLQNRKQKERPIVLNSVIWSPHVTSALYSTSLTSSFPQASSVWFWEMAFLWLAAQNGQLFRKAIIANIYWKCSQRLLHSDKYILN